VIDHRSTTAESTVSELVLAIVEALSEDGLASNQYQLQNHIDTDALAQLRASTGDTFICTFTVEDKLVTVTADGVEVEARR
jgi:hypothetical protein